MTTLTWNAPGVTSVEIHINSPAGPDFGGGGPTGSITTGNWVTDGTTFFLQDVSGGKPLTAANTLAQVTVKVSDSAGPPIQRATLQANPSQITVSDGSGLGITTLTWNAPGATAVEIHINSTSGANLVSGGPTGSATTGKWVSDGMTFFLQDVSSGQPAINSPTIAKVTVRVISPGSTPGPGQGAATLTATPAPLVLGPGITSGKITLTWNAPGFDRLVIRVNGTDFTGAVSANGSIATGDWVVDGMVFSLVDLNTGRTLASLTTVVIPGVQPTVSVAPNSYEYAADGSGVPVTVFWNAPGYSKLGIISNDGSLFSANLALQGSVVFNVGGIGPVRFDLRNTPGMQPIGSGALLASATTNMLPVPVLTSQTPSDSCDRPAYTTAGPTYSIASSAPKLAAWVPLDRANVGDSLRWFVVDPIDNSKVLIAGNPVVLKYAGPGACAWSTFDFAGSTLAARGGVQVIIGLNGFRYGQADVAVH